MLPITCIRPGPSGSVAYVVDGQNRVRVRPVKTAEKAHDLITITGGIQPGDRVVVERQEGLAEDSAVEPQPAGNGS